MAEVLQPKNIHDLDFYTTRLVEQRTRAYGISALPVLTDSAATRRNADDVRLALYGQVLAAWKQLVDVRFKLLGLLPAVSVVALATIATAFRDSSGPYRAALALLGFAGAAITAGIWVYDTRNSELHNDLISRARRIEAELGVHTGVMLGRLGPHSVVRHGVAIGLVYAVVAIAWIVASAWMVVGTI